jgi:protein gp37
MGEKTEISWTEHTFSPWHGCTKVSPACDHCYAESFSRRVGYSETGSHFPIWGKDAERRFFGAKHWAEPLKWNRDAEKAGERRRVFCGSMCDVMEEGLRFYNGRTNLYALIESTPNLDWLLLTKRPQNFSRFLPQAWTLRGFPKNVWLGTTVESPEYLWRVDKLREMYGATVRFLSVEPLLARITLDLTGIDWVIVGGESGHGSRPMHPDWARSIRDQCVAAGVAFHFKQFGEYGPWADHQKPMTSTGRIYMWPDGKVARLSDNVGASGFRYSTVLERVGKKAAGRLLDCRTWDERPMV